MRGEGEREGGREGGGEREREREGGREREREKVKLKCRILSARSELPDLTTTRSELPYYYPIAILSHCQI